jgi:lipopolysaccharide export system permease protein
MKLGILQRYLIREILGVFILSLVIFTLVLLMGRMIKLMEMVVANGVPLAEVLHLIGLLLPSFLVLTIPMALLLAVLLAQQVRRE